MRESQKLPQKPLTVVRSLGDWKRRQEQLLQKQQTPSDQRLSDLELDLLRAIDQLLDVTDRVEKLESNYRTLVRCLLQD